MQKKDSLKEQVQVGCPSDIVSFAGWVNGDFRFYGKAGHLLLSFHRKFGEQ